METKQFKENVRSAAEYLAQAGHDVPHTRLLEAITRVFGERNWSTMRALLEGQAPAAPTAEQASPETNVPVTWKPEFGPMPDALFVRHGGNRCPVCESTDLESDAPEADGPTAHDDTKCEECGSTWSTDYVVMGYSNLWVGPNAPKSVRSEVVDALVEDVRDKARKHHFSVHTLTEARDLVSETNDLFDYEATDMELDAAAAQLLG